MKFSKKMNYYPNPSLLSLKIQCRRSTLNLMDKIINHFLEIRVATGVQPAPQLLKAKTSLTVPPSVPKKLLSP